MTEKYDRGAIKFGHKPCARCKTNKRQIVQKRATGEYYAWSLCPDCEKARKAGKSPSKVVSTPKLAANTLVFETPVQALLWHNEISGQLSDGYWENTTPMEHWKAWCNAEVVVAKEGQKAGRNFPVLKAGYRLSALIEYVGSRMIDEVERETGLKLTEKELRAELNQMAKIMKQVVK